MDHIPGKPYSQRNYRSINKKVARVAFISLKRPVDISFQNGVARIYLDVEERKSNSFKGVLGLQQQSESSSLVGNIELAIQNLFQSGKTLQVDWERFAENAQELLLYYKHPFILGSKLVPSIQLEILRQDSLFLTRSTTLGVGAFLSAKTEFEFLYQRRKGTLLTTDADLISSASLADFTSDGYQVRLMNGDFSLFNQLNELFAWSFKAGVGQKRIDRNLSLADSFYDTLSLVTDVFNFKLELGKQIKLKDRLSFYQHVSGGVIENKELLNNELFRVGGLHSLRGFNEKFFFANQYLITRSELRSFFERGSYLYLFYDQLFISNRQTSDTPFGTGFGFSLETSSGQFSFAMAIGKSKDQSFDVANLKAHFGYLTRF